MESKISNHDLIEFAEQRLEEHIAELNAHYQGREMASDDEKKKAIDTHFNMFKAELEEKSKELGNGQEHTAIIKEYEKKFRQALP